MSGVMSGHKGVISGHTSINFHMDLKLGAYAVVTIEGRENRGGRERKEAFFKDFSIVTVFKLEVD